LVAVNYGLARKQLTTFNEKFEEFALNKITFTKIFAALKSSEDLNSMLSGIGYLSGLCFAAGTLLGICTYIPQ
jgi:hypothetical protein